VYFEACARHRRGEYFTCSRSEWFNYAVLGSATDLNINLGDEDECDKDSQGNPINENGNEMNDEDANSDVSLTPAEQIEDYYINQPKWHPPWQLKQVLFYIFFLIIQLYESPIN